MIVLLDTHVLLWAVGPARRLPQDIRQTLSDPANTVLFSAVSIWEIAIKTALGRPDFRNDPARVAKAAADQGFVELPVHSRHAAHVLNLPPLHHDPFDRLLLAQALVEPAWFITADRQLERYGGPIRLI
ncbi:MAG: type II toxin-antitoxin system VapC family toxin [Rubrivivax sp.]